MKCDDVLVNLPDYVLGKVEPNLERSIASHLELCRKCPGELASVENAIEVLGGVRTEVYPDVFWQQLRVSIMERISEPKPARWRVPALAAGTAVLLLAIGISIYEHSLNSQLQSPTITTLAASLPSEEVVELTSLNVNFANSASPLLNESNDISSVDDSLQLAVVKSMWTSVADSSQSLEDFEYTGETVSN